MLLTFLSVVTCLFVAISWVLFVIGVRSESIRTKLVLINMSLMVLGVLGLAIYAITLGRN